MINFSFAFFNIRSLTKNFAEFKTFLLRKKYDVVGISETWLSHDIFDNLLTINGYVFVRRDRPARGGGIGIYLRAGLRYVCLRAGVTGDLEELWLRIFFNSKEYIFGVLYRPPSGRFSNFLECFEDSISEFLPICSEVICGGDANIDMLDFEGLKTVHFNRSLESFNLQQIINTPTRLTKSTSTLLDVIILSRNENCIVGTENVNNISDHLLVFCQYGVDKVRKTCDSYRGRNLRHVDGDHLLGLLRATPFEIILHINNINNKVACFTSLILNLFDVVAPIREIKRNKINPPWLTNTIKKMISLKNKASNKYKKTKLPDHWNYYKQIKNETTNAINREKKGYMEFCLDRYKNDGKTLWKKFSDLDLYNKKKTICFT